MQYFETSCYDGVNVELAVMTMVARLMPEEAAEQPKQDTSMHERKQETETSRSCCIT